MNFNFEELLKSMIALGIVIGVGGGLVVAGLIWLAVFIFHHIAFAWH